MTSALPRFAAHPIFFKVVPGGRRIWASAGAWERFFILAPWISIAYLLALIVVVLLDPLLYSDSRVAYPFLTLQGLGVSYFILLDAWIAPLFLSSRILRVVSHMEEFKEDFQRGEREFTALVTYLDSLGHRGRWMRGNLLSLAYFIVQLAWGIAALRLHLLFGIEHWLLGVVVFFALILPSSFLMLWLYHHALNRMAEDAARRGFRFIEPRPA